MNDSITELVRAIVREEIEKVLKAQPTTVIRIAPLEKPKEPDRPVRNFDGHEPTWTTAHVAEFLGLKRKTIYNRISNGRLPKPRKNGRLNAFIPSEIVEYRRQTLDLDR